MTKNIFVILIILILITVGLMIHQDYLITKYTEKFNDLGKCQTYKNCKKCLSSAICAWSNENSVCIPIPQNASGLVINKSNCPDDIINVKLIDLDVQDQPTDDNQMNLQDENVQADNLDSLPAPVQSYSIQGQNVPYIESSNILQGSSNINRPDTNLQLQIAEAQAAAQKLAGGQFAPTNEWINIQKASKGFYGATLPPKQIKK